MTADALAQRQCGGQPLNISAQRLGGIAGMTYDRKRSVQRRLGSALLPSRCGRDGMSFLLPV
jgi:hypothetical protein